MNELLPTDIITVHTALVKGDVPHAFGGAIALAYAGSPRYTHDIDINIALSQEHGPRVLDILAPIFPIRDREKAERELRTIAQTRLRWGDLPIDLFFANTPIHDSMATRSREVDFMGVSIPVISAEDLVICKSLFNRTKDWLDIENIFRVREQIGIHYIRHWLNEFCEPEDERILRIEEFFRDYQQRDGSEIG